ncbi:MAG: aminotransferase class I/II-fold pyridoxal phosphate-dependent enzyme [bacterium]
MQIDPLAFELNEQIRKTSKNAYACLSETGRQIYFPAGILTQSAEAKQKAKKFNATIGIALENHAPMHLEATMRYFNHLKSDEIFTYAPPEGLPGLRRLWKDKIVRRNPTLTGKQISLPIVTSALTHGLSLIADLFIDAGDVIILPDKLWGVYNLIFSTRRGGRIATFPMFNAAGGFNVAGMADLMKKEAKTQAKLTILLNTPNNPTGYTPSVAECQSIYEVVLEQANQGSQIVMLSDDAYFGLFYEDSMKESLFSGFCDLHENVLAVKLDAATKEHFVWGFRTGFITFGTVTQNPELLYQALEMKLKGLLRSTISSSNHASQHIIENILKDPDYEKGINEKFQILKKRALKLKRILSDSKFDPDWDFYPFNSGYFMCLKLHRVNAEVLRKHLLDQYQIGTISLGDSDLRIAFSCIEEEDIDELVSLIHQAVRDLT